ncbi:unnamed protein product [Paramecium sonneborni]|uniref:PWWP domain-containing protein n=1 Tax=Paramecium sonneborni TaxID=65129 RepID=A0A8S1Q4S6_9CILI|nr:unnamed protein product [Paramecium sonneborni]
MQQGCDVKFEINEVVWAKVLGYPWWPAQISSISNRKTSTIQLWRVNFLADGTHADLRLEKIRKWNDRPIQTETKKLKEAIELANKILNGNYQNILPSLQNLNEHLLKSLVIRLYDLIRNDKQMDDVVQLLNEISSNELLSIVKMNLGQQLFRLHQIHQSKRQTEFENLLQSFIDQLINSIGYKEQIEQTNSNKKKFKQFLTNEEPLEEITKCVIIQDGPDSKRKKVEENLQNTSLNQ